MQLGGTAKSHTIGQSVRNTWGKIAQQVNQSPLTTATHRKLIAKMSQKVKIAGDSRFPPPRTNTGPPHHQKKKPFAPLKILEREKSAPNTEEASQEESYVFPAVSDTSDQDY